VFINPRLVYLQLHKTACTHVATLLAALVGGHQVGKHDRLDRDPGARRIVGSVRNPWDWYVSLWAFGCSGRGEVYERLVSGPAGERWLDSYRDRGDPRRFRNWLLMLADPDRSRKVLPEYGGSTISRDVGLLTYRYLWLYSRKISGLLHLSASDLREFDVSQNLLTDVIRSESLERDLLTALTNAGYTLDLSIRARVAARNRNKTNASSHREAGFYYDEETYELVASRDDLVISKYGYEPPVRGHLPFDHNHG
jgi:hypothetical protein